MNTSVLICIIMGAPFAFCAILFAFLKEKVAMVISGFNTLPKWAEFLRSIPCVYSVAFCMTLHAVSTGNQVICIYFNTLSSEEFQTLI